MSLRGGNDEAIPRDSHAKARDDDGKIMDIYHIPVLLDEVVSALRVELGKKFIDATLGGGGHTKAILERGGIVLGIDVDQESIGFVESQFKIQNSKFKIGKELVLAKGNFRDIGEIARNNGFEQVEGIVFDVGVSSYQLQAGERGFSFQTDAPLDMRMDTALSVKASDLVNGLYKDELTKLFKNFGEEPFARRISDAIVSTREIKPITTTGELARLVQRVKPRIGKIHPATHVFQALRIAVNDELGSLEKALPQAYELLSSHGRIAVISFHSLEDRIVKGFQKEYTGVAQKPITPSEDEISKNPRARSAKLRIIEKGSI